MTYMYVTVSCVQDTARLCAYTLEKHNRRRVDLHNNTPVCGRPVISVRYRWTRLNSSVHLVILERRRNPTSCSKKGPLNYRTPNDQISNEVNVWFQQMF